MREGIDFNVPGEENASVQPPIESSEAQVTPTEGVTPPTETAPPIEPDWFRLEKFNERFGTEAKSEDDIKEYVRSLNENREFINKRQTYEALEKEYYDLVGNIEKKYQEEFPTPEAEKAYFFKQSLLQGGRDAGVVERIVNSDWNKLSPVELLTLDLQFSAPKLAGKTELATKAVLSDYGVDVESLDFKLNDASTWGLSEIGQAKMEAKAAQIRSTLEATKASVKVPERPNYKQNFEEKIKQQEESRKKTVDEWNSKAKDIATKFTKWERFTKDSTGKDVLDFSFEVPKEFIDSAIPNLVDWAVTNNIQPTPEGIQKAQEELKEAFREIYFEQIIEALEKEKAAAAEERVKQKYENPKPINTTEAPVVEGKTPEQRANERLLELSKMGMNF